MNRPKNGDSPATGRREHVLAAVLSLVSAALLWAAFPPVDFGPIAWLALAPWLVMVGRTSPKRAALWSALAGYVFFVASLHWLRFVTAAGWLALALYCAAYWPVAALLLKGFQKRNVPLALSAPLVLTLLEFVRAHLFTGFPFLFLGHTQYRLIPVIQIADITGAYGITFLIALVNGCIADYVLGGRRIDRRMAVTFAATLALLLLTVGYGMARGRLKDDRSGPKVCLVQANIPLDLKHSPSLDDLVGALNRHVELSEEAAGQDVDLVIWAETVLPTPINHMYNDDMLRRLRESEDERHREYGAFVQKCRDAMARALRSVKTHFLVGAQAESYPPLQRNNSACFLSPKGDLIGRYDKIHLVVFGEYTPLVKTFPFLGKLRPPQMGPDLDPGSRSQLRQPFELPWRNGERKSRFGVTICYEDAEASIFREFVRNGVDFMVNITNDGWFRDSSELDTHLAVCAFRAVENRVPIARCANTGISAIILPNGVIADRIAAPDGRYREVEGTLVGNLTFGSRRSFYTAYGDVFAWLCALGTACMAVAAVVSRSGGPPGPKGKPPKTSRVKKRARR